MDGTGGRQFAAKKMKGLDPEHSGMEFGIYFEKFLECTAGDIATARERHVWMPGT